MLSSAVHVHSWAEISESVVGEGCEIGRRAQLQRVILDKFCTVEPGARVGFDREHDLARGFTISDRGVVAVPKGTHITA